MNIRQAEEVAELVAKLKKYSDTLDTINQILRYPSKATLVLHSIGELKVIFELTDIQILKHQYETLCEGIKEKIGSITTDMNASH